MKLPFSLGLLILLTSCQSSYLRQEEYIVPYQRGQLLQAKEEADRIVNYDIPEGNYRRSKEAVMWLLDRATLNFMLGEVTAAIYDYQLAIEAIDYYNQDCTIEDLQQLMLQDDYAAYPGEDFEQILARFYFALALLQQGDEGNALALLRQAEELQQKKREMYRNSCLTKDFVLIDNPLAKYLMAVLLEHRGDLSNAEILYAQTESLIGNSLEKLQLRQKGKDSEQATVIILAHNGNVPYKVSTLSDASQASTIALEFLLGNCNLPPAYSSITGIPVPILMQKIFSHPVPIHTRLCRQERQLIPFYNIAAIDSLQLQQKMPIILARGAARYILRRGMIAYLNERDACLGAIADMGMLVSNACTRADTRSWGTLPSSIDLTRYEVPSGDHTLHLQIQWGVVAPFIDEFAIKLNPGDLCVINIFNIHPGIVAVQIPKKYKINP